MYNSTTGDYFYNNERRFTTISGLDNVTSYGFRCFYEQHNLVLDASDITKAQTVGEQAFRRTNLTGDLIFTNFHLHYTIKSIGCFLSFSSK